MNRIITNDLRDEIIHRALGRRSEDTLGVFDMI